MYMLQVHTGALAGVVGLILACNCERTLSKRYSMHYTGARACLHVQAKRVKLQVTNSMRSISSIALQHSDTTEHGNGFQLALLMDAELRHGY
jgi:hypothetical protein